MAVSILVGLLTRVTRAPADQSDLMLVNVLSQGKQSPDYPVEVGDPVSCCSSDRYPFQFPHMDMFKLFYQLEIIVTSVLLK